MTNDGAAGAAYHLRPDTDLAAIATLNAWLHDIAGAHDLEAARFDRLKLSLNEWVTNVISYAFDGVADPALSIALRVQPDEIVALVRDNGMPFDPLALPLPQPLTGVADAPIGGYGMKLIRERASALAYQRTGGENVLRLTFRNGA